MTVSYRVRVGWAGRDAGVARVGSARVSPTSPSQWVGYDRIGYPFTPSFSGVYDDITTDVVAVRVRRGSDDGLAQVSQGEFDVIVADPAGRYNPSNPASPLAAAGLLRPMRPCSVEASLDSGQTWHGLAYGWLESIEPDPRSRQATLHFTDIFSWLRQGAAKPVIASTGPTTTGAVIGMILDAVAWTNPAMRSLDTGVSIPDFSADGSRDALSLIEDLLVVDPGGRFYQRGDGVVMYRDHYRLSRDRSPSVAVSDVVANVSPGVSLGLVRNRQRVTRTGGAAQVYDDQASQQEFGVREPGAIETPYLADDGSALALARYLVGKGAEPRGLVWSCTLPASAAPISASVDLGCVVDVSEDAAGTRGVFVVERVELALLPGQIQASWGLSELPAQLDALVGTSTVAPDDPSQWTGYDRVAY